MFHSRSHPKTLAPSSARALASSTPLLKKIHRLQPQSQSLKSLKWNPTCQRRQGRCKGSSQLWWSPPSSCWRTEVGCCSTLCSSQSSLRPLWNLKISKYTNLCLLQTTLRNLLPWGWWLLDLYCVDRTRWCQNRARHRHSWQCQIDLANWIVSTWESHWWCCVPCGHRSGPQQHGPPSPFSPRIACSQRLQQGRRGEDCLSWWRTWLALPPVSNIFDCWLYK